jgi:hypothetical protein
MTRGARKIIIEYFSRVQWLTNVILATQEAEIRKTVIQVQSRQKVHEPLSQPIKLGIVAHTCHLTYTGGINRSQHRQEVSETPISTNKKLGTMAHVCHPSDAGSINRRIAGRKSETLIKI